MPKHLEKKLMQQAEKFMASGKLRKKHDETAKEAKDRYVYGTMQKKKMLHRKSGKR